MIVVKVIRRGAKNTRVQLKNGNTRLIETEKLPFYLPIESEETLTEVEEVSSPVGVVEE